jgi:hypothetical protein
MTLVAGPLTDPTGRALEAGAIEILRVGYLNLAQASDRSATPGFWPDPLFPFDQPVVLEAGINHAFWIRLHVPREAAAGTYRGAIGLSANGWRAQAPLEVVVYDFDLPERMTCTTAFGFSPGNVFRYHRLQSEADRRAVLQKYWANLAAHHISPYNPAPLDPIGVDWPDIKPPPTGRTRWTGLRIVTNEVHSGTGALLIYDDRVDENVTVTYEPLLRIPPRGLQVRFSYRTAVPGHRFLVSLNHYDAAGQWMSGRNNDVVMRGRGTWQSMDELVTDFPPGATHVRLHARATTWTEAGEEVGLVWLDDVSIRDPDSSAEMVEGGDFEPVHRTEPVVPLDQLRVRLDFESWDRAMYEAFEVHRFNSFRLGIPGLGGGTFHALVEPSLLGFEEQSPEYPLLLESYCRQIETHLREKGWLEWAYVYWFDEPSPDQYPFVMNGFAKLKRFCPSISRMLTEQVESDLTGGPNVWCSISNAYDHDRAEERRRHGEQFWWYVCTGPKAPYAGLFIDHPAPEMRLWLWQTWQRNIEGILVWQVNYWTSSAAYPEAAQPQNPYEDPMSWTSGYSTPTGERRAWGNGDGRFIYPPESVFDPKREGPILDGPVDSIRWEHLRDGIEDYEYLCLLRRLLAEAGTDLPADSRAEWARLLEVPETITRTLTDFAPDGGPIEERRHQVAQAIERLMRL